MKKPNLQRFNRRRKLGVCRLNKKMKLKESAKSKRLLKKMQERMNKSESKRKLLLRLYATGLRQKLLRSDD